MSGYQKAQRRIPLTSSKTPAKYVNKRFNPVQHIQSLSNGYDKNAAAIDMYKLQAGVHKQLQMDWVENQTDRAHFKFKQTQFRAHRTKYTPNAHKHRLKI